MCLLVTVKGKPIRRSIATTVSLQSLFNKEDNCKPGNLLQIHSVVGGRGQARCDGESTEAATTSKSHYKLR